MVSPTDRQRISPTNSLNERRVSTNRRSTGSEGSSSSSASSSSSRRDRDRRKDDKSEEGITVAIRMRPLNTRENDKRRVWKVVPKYSAITQTTKAGKPLPEKIMGRTFFQFDRVFGEESSTKGVYDSVAKGIVTNVVGGLNGTIFAYGQTSSGKTFTMQGSGTIQEGNGQCGGLVHMAARDIFEKIQQNPDRIFLVRTSFLEIYNEEVRDLLSDSNRTLPIREDPRRGVFVQSMEEIVSDYESLLRVLFQGEKSRSVAATGMNERSSRSHTIFRVTIESRMKETGKASPSSDDSDDDSDTENKPPSGDGAVRISTLNLVDLAGSESVRHTGATGERQKEGGMINQSLLTLSQVIVKLGQPTAMHINFRDSKLTRILQPSLSGNARMAVICCATPSELYLEETRSTLQFASRAKLVKTNAKVNEVLDERSMIRKLQRELAEAKRRANGSGDIQQLKELEDRAATAGTAAIEAKEKLDRLKASILNVGSIFTATHSPSGRASRQSQKMRRRRRSDGAFQIQRSTPTKDSAPDVPAPSTIPRPMKKSKIAPPKPLEVSNEIQLIRAALTSKARALDAMGIRIEDYLRHLDAKQKTIDEQTKVNENLAAEGEGQRHRTDEMSSIISSLRQELEGFKAQCTDISSQREIERAEAEQLISGITADRASAIESIEILSGEIETLKKENRRNAFSIAEVLDQKELLIQEKGRENAMVQKLVTRIQAMEEDRSDMQAKIASLKDNLQNSSNARDELTEELTHVKQACADGHEQLASVQNSLQTTTRALNASKLEAEIKTVALRRQEEASQTALNRKAEELESRQADVLRLRQDNANLEQKLGTEVEERTRLQFSVKALEENAIHHSAEMEELRQQFVMSASRCSALQMDLLEMKEKADEAEVHQHTIETLKIELQTSEQRIADAEEQLATTSQQHDDEVSTLMTQLQRGQDRIAELETSKRRSSDECATLKQELGESVSKVEHLEAEALSILELLEQTTQTKNKAEGELKGVFHSKEDVERQLKDTAARLDEANETLEEAMDALKELEEFKKAAQADLLDANRSKESLQTEVADKAAACAQLESRLSNLEATSAETYADLEAKIDSMAHDREELAKKNDELATDLNEASMNLEQLTEHQQATAASLKAKEAELFSMTQARDDLLVQLARAEEQREQLSQELASSSGTCSQLEDNATKLQETVDQLRQTLSQTQGELEALTKQSAQQQKHHEEAINQANTAAGQTAAQAAEQISDLETKSHEQRLKLGATEAELSTANEELESSKSLLQQVMADLEHAKADLEQAKDEIAAKADVEALLEEREEACKSLHDINEKITADVSQCRAELEELRLNSLASEEKLGQLEGELAKSKHQHDQLQLVTKGTEAELQSNAERLAEQHQKYDELLAEKERAELLATARIVQLESTHAELLTKVEGLTVCLSNAHEDLEVSMLTTARLEHELGSTTTALAGKHEVEIKLDEYRAQCDELVQTNELLRQNLTHCEQHLGQSEGAMEELKEQLESASVEAVRLRTSKQDLQKSLENLQRELEEAEASITEHRAMQQTMTTEHERSAAEAACAASTRIAELEATNQELSTKVTEVTLSRSQMEERLLFVTAEAEDLRKQLQASCKRLDEISELECSLSQRDSTIKDMEEHLTKLEGEAADTKQLLEESRGNLKTLAEENDELCEELDLMTDQSVRLHELSQVIQTDLEEAIDDNIRLAYEKQTVEATLLETRKERTDVEDDAKVIRAKLQAAENEADEMRQLLLAARNEAEMAAHVGEQLRAMEEKSHQLMEQVDESHSQQESMQRTMEEQSAAHEAAVQELQQSRESLMSKLRNLEGERDASMSALESQYEEVSAMSKDLESAREQCDKLKKQVATLESTQRKIQELESVNQDLKHLLDVSNASVEEARSAAIAADDELKAKERELEDLLYRNVQLEEELKSMESPRATGQGNSNSSIADLHFQIDELGRDNEEMRLALEQAKCEREESESTLRRQMGDEQRALIQEGEQRMHKLRAEAEDLRTALKASDSEGYAARQQLEVLRDRADHAEKKVLQTEKEKVNLEARLSSQGAQLSTAMSELSAAKMETYSQRGAVDDLKSKLHKAQENLDSSKSEANMLRRKLSRVEADVRAIQDERDKLKQREAKLALQQQQHQQQHQQRLASLEEVEGLEKQLLHQSAAMDNLKSQLATKERQVQTMRDSVAASRTASEMAASAKTRANELEGRIGELISEMKTKDARIKKLEAVRLTKEQYANIKRMRKERDTFEKELKVAAADLQKHVTEIDRLRQEIASTSGGAETSELRFHKEVMEKKIRKYSTQLQQAEEEKTSMMQMIRSSIPSLRKETSAKQAISDICNKLIALEGNAEGGLRRTSNAKDVEDCKEEIASLRKGLKKSHNDYQEAVTARQILQQALNEAEERLSRAIAEREETGKQLEELRNEGASGGDDLRRKFKFLEQENLQLMLESKKLKKQAKLARDEVEMMKLDATNEPTIDFSKPSTFSKRQRSEATVAGTMKSPLAGHRNRPLRVRSTNLDEGTLAGRGQRGDNRMNSATKAQVGDATEQLATSKVGRRERHAHHLVRTVGAPSDSNNDKENVSKSTKHSTPSRTVVGNKRKIFSATPDGSAHKMKAINGPATRARAVPGLGEAALNADDTPAECQQS